MSEAATTTSIVSLAIDGMSSRACVARLERALSDVPAVLAVNVRLESESAKVELGDMQTEAAAIAAVEALLAATAGLGFKAHLRGYEGPPVSDGTGADDVDAGADAKNAAPATTAADHQRPLEPPRVDRQEDTEPEQQDRAWQEREWQENRGMRASRRLRDSAPTPDARIEPGFGPDPSDLPPSIPGAPDPRASRGARPDEVGHSFQAERRAHDEDGADSADPADAYVDREPSAAFADAGPSASAPSDAARSDAGYERTETMAAESLVVLAREVQDANDDVDPERVDAVELAALAELAHPADDEFDGAANDEDGAAVVPSSLSRSADASLRPRLVEPGRLSLSGRTVITSCAILTLILLVPAVAKALGLSATLSPSLQFSLATVVLLLASGSVSRTAWQSLRRGRASAELLAVAGSASAWLLSIWLWGTGRAPDALHFETAAGVATLALAGQYLLYRTRRKAQDALDELAAAQPEHAIRIVSVDVDALVDEGQPGGQARVQAEAGAGSADDASILRGRPIREHPLPADELTGGEIIMIRPGERVPADAIILDGESGIDESVLTGDATPVTRGPDEPVFAGTLNGPGRLFARVERVGPDTTLARVLTRIEDAQASRTTIENKVDRVVGWLVPAALLLALLTCGFWLWEGAGAESAMARGIAVLVVAFPCALGLAAPAALIAGTRAAARSGILMRDATVIEAMPAIRTVAFEQTGSLTEGRPGVRDILPAPGIDRESLLAVAAAIEEHSTHPLPEAVQRFADGAPAIADAARAAERADGRSGPDPAAPARPASVLRVEAEAVRPIEGAGIEGRVRFPGAADDEALPVFIGSEALMLEQGVDLAPLADELEVARNEGWTVSLVAMARPDSDPMLLGALLFADTPRPGARSAVEALRKAGIAPVMLSPAPANAARSTGATLGIEETVGELEPRGVDGWIQRARESGRGVAMVGDAIDDAETLDSADLGVAMSNDSAGRDVAIDTAPLTLMRNDVRLVPAAFDIGRRTYGNLRQNLGWALVFNAIGLPLAASGLLTPFTAVVAIGIGMLFVQGNAMRLGQWKPGQGGAPF